MNVAVVARGNIFLDRTAFTLQVRVAPSGDCNHYMTGASQCKAG